ncbi:MAG TPA: hypothetical protein DGH68_01735 [Bacteroidetes bacterium]|nr:hypothetical protein [Bacteroidota bacterium]
MFLLAFPGCLFVRTSEHIITVKANGGGEGIIHLIDIRSTAPSDSLVKRDFDELMNAYGAATVEEFESYGRKITGKRLRVLGDTLMAEITYTFSSLGAIDGLRATKDEMTLTFAPEREVTRTNGKKSQTEDGGTLITWERDAERLVYEVWEKQIPSSTSLAPLYMKYLR